jgi:hypothetical protein
MVQSLEKSDKGKSPGAGQKAIQIFDRDYDDGIFASDAHPLRPLASRAPHHLAEARLRVFELPAG